MRDSTPSISNNIKGNVKVTKERKVAELVGMSVSYPTIAQHPLVVGKSLAGIEIELEGIPNPSESMRYWEAKGDGSLRDNGVEYVCSSPWGGLDLYNAVVEVDTELHEKHPSESWRCSTHVHVDVRDLTIPQLKRMILAYVFYEKILFRCSGFHRYKNNFCVAVGYAQEMVNILSSHWDLKGSDFIRNITGSWDKYTALNILPINTFGSLEFRISEAKWRKGKLVRLANRFLSLKEVAVSFEGEDTEFIEFLLTKKVEEVILKGIPKDFQVEPGDIEFGAKMAFDIILLSVIKKKSKTILKVDLSDGSRVLNLSVPSDRHSIWSAACNHVKSVLSNKHDTTFENDTFPEVFTMDFLCKLKSMLRGEQWGDEWFLPRGMPACELVTYYNEVYNQ